MAESITIQIYVAHPDDTELCDQLGVDLIGVVVDPWLRTPSSLSIAGAAEAFSRIHNAKKVALCMDTAGSACMDTIRETTPDILHIGCDPSSLRPAIIDELLSQPLTTELMFAIPVNGSNPQAAMHKLNDVADYFIFDTSDPSRPDVSATGQTHDWKMSAKLVSETETRVVLAGGLSPENVANAIDIVRPWAVDSFTKTNRDGSVRKDLNRLRAFIEAARAGVKDNK